mmetsp:Transcript_13807/g.39755  ORF Transcript_13807/g.39755 Transcript_13807/m.39755 type:complete len:308 (-) Transcript_13807:112-1035(-)|eukprot:CAMPEP_0176090100 /NCGR_PEP_ID=MMETSP0120_2-20121206/45125_1 /TAXON_ID=160619 /ORGANISM="Kryptoperidinium foliaceum, Strain CCMP 1326" /LENGTH=307 /DNA_ID=CAMNT_0017423983 /DNA_START=43 /DNA_END=966 /DNA_ORIENTATION=+
MALVQRVRLAPQLMDAVKSARSDEPAVFVESPARRQERRRERLREWAERAKAGDLAAMGLKRSTSEQSLPIAAACEWAPAAGFSGSGVVTKAASHSGACARTTRKMADEASLALRDLHRGIMKRAAEQTLFMQLKQHSMRQRLRYGGAAAPTACRGGACVTSAAGCGDSAKAKEERATMRRCTNALAVNFTERYSATLSIMEGHMTLARPSRRHTLDLQAYMDDVDSSPNGSAQPGAGVSAIPPAFERPGFAPPPRRGCDALAFVPPPRRGCFNDAGSSASRSCSSSSSSSCHSSETSTTTDDNGAP